MAEAILIGLLERREVDAEVLSAGTQASGQPMDPVAMDAVARDGPEMREHLSRPIRPLLLQGADLVIAMEREHVREIVVNTPNAWEKTFTFKELVRRGEKVGPKFPGEAVVDWLGRAGRDRDRQDLLGASHDDDIEDPIGMQASAIDHTADVIRALCTRLVDLLAPPP
jgi:protein-tyrosine phosphatase